MSEKARWRVVAYCHGVGKGGENSDYRNGDQSYPVHKHAPVKTASAKIKNGKRFWLKLRALEDRGKRSKGNTVVPGQGYSSSTAECQFINKGKVLPRHSEGTEEYSSILDFILSS